MTPTEGPPHNLLLLSDLHLGEQTPHEERRKVQERADFQSSQLQSFLAHHSTHRHQDRPWRLVIAGDFLDFMHLHTPHEPHPQVWSVPAWTPQSAQDKLLSLFSLHHQTFLALIDFIAAGNSIALITGNHDAELNWPVLQEQFIQHLETLAAQRKSPAQGQLAEHLRFCPWYYAEESLLYVEHGHLHDRLCTIDSFLDLTPDAPMLSVSHLATRAQYKCQDVLGQFSPHEADQLSVTDVIQHIFRQPLRQQLAVLRVTLATLLIIFRLAWRKRTDALKHQHAHALTKEHGLTPNQLQKLYAIQAPPLYDRFFDIVQILYLDRLLLVAGSAAVVVCCLRSSASPFLLAGILTLSSFLFVRLYISLARRCPVALAAPGMLSAAFKIAEHIDVPLVVFGHNHHFEQHNINDQTMYVNLGTWSPTLEEIELCKTTNAFSQVQPFLRIVHHDPHKTAGAHKSQVQFCSWSPEGRTILQATHPLPPKIPQELIATCPKTRDNTPQVAYTPMSPRR